MKPGDHPEFYRWPAPEGRSRESSIVLDKQGRFLHDGERVEHAGLAAGFHRWISRHPDDGRYILDNGYDWTYFTVEDTPYFVTSLRIDGDAATLTLSDGSEEALDPRTLALDAGGVLRVAVKDGSFSARFSRAAQLAIAPLLVEHDGDVGLELNGVRHSIAAVAIETAPITAGPIETQG